MAKACLELQELRRCEATVLNERKKSPPNGDNKRLMKKH